MPEHDPTGWVTTCHLRILNPETGAVVGICGVAFRVRWHGSQHRGEREPHDCRATQSLAATIAAHQLDEVKQ